MTEKAITRVGIVGAGKMGELHLRKLLEIPSAQVVGFFEPSLERAKEIQAKYSVPPVATLAELLFDVDAVFIACPTRQHFQMARQALISGVHVFIEKPIASTQEEAEILVNLARENQLQLQVGYLERYRFSYLLPQIDAKNLYLIEARRCSPSLGRDTSIDVVEDLMVHDLDLLLSLVTGEPTILAAVGGASATPLLDVAHVTLSFSSSVSAILVANRVSPVLERVWRLFTRECLYEVDLANTRITTHRYSARGIGEGTMTEAIHFDALLAQDEDFLQSVRESRLPRVSGESALRVLKWADAIRAQLTQGPGARRAAVEKPAARPLEV